MSKIKEIKAKEIQDSRGKPTVEVELTTDKGVFRASVPSGKSTGKNEALELRDADGKGVSKAIENINTVIAKALVGMDPTEQKALDEIMLKLDGTENKSNLGANAILAVSLAVCRGGAATAKLPLYLHITNLSGYQLKSKELPYPMFNIINGGAHAENDLDIQEFMIVPQKKIFAENLALGSKIFDNLTKILKENYGEVPALGDEGGYAPKISKAEQALFMLKSAIGSDSDVKISLDCAASEFYKDGKYALDGKEFSRAEMVEYYKDLVQRFPIITIEDPFEEGDWEGFKDLHRELPRIVIIGDDLTTTNVKKF